MSSAVVGKIWKDFCDRFQIAATCVPLFAQDSKGNVKTREIGQKPGRLVLERSEEMELRVVQIVQQLIDDYNKHPHGEREFDGMLYMMG